MDTLPHLMAAHRRSTWHDGGVRAHELTTQVGRRVHQGRWGWAGTDAADPVVRALGDASVLPPDGALGGWGAAQLLGVTWLDGTSPGGRQHDGLLCLPPRLRVRRPGIAVQRSRLDPGDVVRVRDWDVRVTSPVRTAFDLARRAPDLATAVGHLDAVLAHGVIAGDVDQYARERSRWRGSVRVRRALTSASGRVRSPAETRWRLLWEAAGLPRPLVNATVTDLDGTVVGEVDLVSPALGLVGEYDGSPHNDADQRAHDAVRQEALEELGLVVVRGTSRDLAQRAVAAGRLRRAAARASSPPRVQRWRVVERPLQVGRLREFTPD